MRADYGQTADPSSVQLSLLEPTARTSDPATSHLAAKVVSRGNDAMIAAIRRYVRERGTSTAFKIAEGVNARNPGRWQLDSLRSCCARAGLERIEYKDLPAILKPEARSPRGRPVCMYRYGAMVVRKVRTKAV